MIERTASCCCGQLRVLARGEPVRISVCHCLACQRRTGSAFGAQARFPRDAVRILGSSREYQRRGDSGALLRFHFCPECGSTVHYSIDNDPERVAIPLGAFADPGFPAPRVEVYGGCRHPWVELPDIVPEP